MEEKDSNILCVDLDGTLLRGDLLIENIANQVRNNPFRVIDASLKAYAAFRVNEHYKAYLKHELARDYKLDPNKLIFNKEVVDFLKERKEAGAKIYLVTASNEKLARIITEHFDFIVDCIASDQEFNIKGATKAKFLENRFGLKGFDYIGNDKSDVHVWIKANKSYGVDCNFDVISKAKSRGIELNILKPYQTFDERRPELISSLRVYQWVKNLLIFVPSFMAHNLFELKTFFASLIAFFIYCCGSSAIYQFNDIIDLESDRDHNTKSNRPIAAGTILPAEALYISCFLLGLAFLFSLLLPFKFFVCFLLYLLLTTFYSLFLKTLLLVDIITLASLYCLRIFSGAMASDILISDWLLSFSLFIFFSLACVKRFSELSIKIHNKKLSEDEYLSGRAYQGSDAKVLSIFGVTSGFISILILALYMNSSEIIQLYASPAILWLLLPVLLYWVARLWILATRLQIAEDPIVYAIKDKASYVVAILAFIIISVAAF